MVGKLSYFLGLHVKKKKCGIFDVTSEKQVEELKEKVESLYSNDDVTTEEIVEAVKELSDALKAEKMF